MLLACLVCFLSALRSHKLLASCGLQYCAASGDDAADILCCEVLDFSFDESVEASIDAFDVKEIVDARSRHGAYGCVHAGSISARRQDTDCFNSAHSSVIIN